MNTKPLDEILKQITPLPYRAELKTIYEAAEPFREIGSADWSEAANPIASIAYITHAANVLPGLVETLRWIAKEQGTDANGMREVATAALATATNVPTS
jgi:hypothetical protein